MPAFKLSVRERPTTLDAALRDLPENLARHDHHRLWYLPHTGVVWEWSADRAPLTQPTELPPRPSWRRTWWNQGHFGRYVFEGLLYVATFNERLVPWINRRYAAALFAEPSQWTRPSIDAFLIDCLFRQHVDEWSIPLERTAEALRRIDALVANRTFIAQLPIEVRFVSADEAWLSPAHGRASCYIGIIAYRPFSRDFAFQPFFLAFEGLMRDLGGRPHWAKSFDVSPDELPTMYKHWEDFSRVRRWCDPRATMSNRFTDRLWPRDEQPVSASPRLVGGGAAASLDETGDLVGQP